MNFIALHGVSYSRMFSRLGRNVQFCSERYGRQVGDMMNANVSLSFISEREYAIARPSVCRLSVTLVHPTRQYFYGIRYLGHPLTSTENFTEIVQLGEPLYRES